MALGCGVGGAHAQGQPSPQALPRTLPAVEQAIAAHPDDPRLRLRQALLLQQAHEDAQAIKVLRALSLRYPELPEPYNNLGVLYAAQGQYQLARAQFEAALRANADYATAASNLGDVYLRLGEQAYERALQGSGDAGARAHAQRMLRQLRAIDTIPRQPAASPPTGTRP